MNQLDPNILKKFEEKWVAITEDHKKVILSGNSVKEVEEKLEEKNIDNAEVMFVLPFDKYYSPSCR